MQKLENAFDDFLDSEEGDRLFGEFQDMVRTAFIEGYKSGRRDSGVVYIVHSPRAGDYKDKS